MLAQQASAGPAAPAAPTSTVAPPPQPPDAPAADAPPPDADAAAGAQWNQIKKATKARAALGRMRCRNALEPSCQPSRKNLRLSAGSTDLAGDDDEPQVAGLPKLAAGQHTARLGPPRARVRRPLLS